MRALSIDLRERIVSAYETGDCTQQQVADRFGVSRSTVSKLAARYRKRGSLETDYKNCGVYRKIQLEDEAHLRELLSERPDRTLEQLRVALGVDCTIQAIHYALKRMGYTFKKRRSVPTSSNEKT